MLWSQKSDRPTEPVVYKYVLISIVAVSYSNFHGLSQPTWGLELHFLPVPLKYLPLPRSFDRLAHSFSFSSGISWNWRRRERRKECVWSLGSGDAVAAPPAVYCAAPTISATAEISPRIDRPRPTAANRKASPLSSPTALLPMWVEGKVLRLLSCTVHATNYCTQIT